MFNLTLSYRLDSNAPVHTLDEILDAGHSILSVRFEREEWPTIVSNTFIEFDSQFPWMGKIELLNLTVKNAPDYDQWKDYLFLPYEDVGNELFPTQWVSIKEMNDCILESDFTPTGKWLHTLADKVFHHACSIAYTDVDEAQKKFLLDLLKKEALALFDESNYRKYSLAYIRKQIKKFIKDGVNAAKNNIPITYA